MGIELNGKSVAYPLSALQKQSPIIDMVGAVPIVVALGEDNRSVRAFERTVDGRGLEFFQKKDDKNPQFQLIDAETGSTWNFEGKATSWPSCRASIKESLCPGRLLVRLAHLSPRYHDLSARSAVKPATDNTDSGTD